MKHHIAKFVLGANWLFDKTVDGVGLLLEKFDICLYWLEGETGKTFRRRLYAFINGLLLFLLGLFLAETFLWMTGLVIFAGVLAVWLKEAYAWALEVESAVESAKPNESPGPEV